MYRSSLPPKSSTCGSVFIHAIPLHARRAPGYAIFLEENPPNTVAVNHFRESENHKIVVGHFPSVGQSAPALLLPSAAIAHRTLPAASPRAVGGTVQPTNGSLLADW